MDYIKTGTHGTYRIPVGAILYLLTSATSTARATCSLAGQGPWVSTNAVTPCGPFTQVVDITVECVSGHSGVDVTVASTGGSSTLAFPSYDAINNVPALASGVAPAVGAPRTYSVTSAGVTLTQAAISGDIPALRNGDAVIWSDGLLKWTRTAGDPLTIAVSVPLTLNDAHFDCTLFCTGTPTITLTAGRQPGFGVVFDGPYTLALGGGVTCPDTRLSGGAPAAAGSSWILQTPTQDTYIWRGGKL